MSILQQGFRTYQPIIGETVEPTLSQLWTGTIAPKGMLQCCYAILVVYSNETVENLLQSQNDWINLSEDISKLP